MRESMSGLVNRRVGMFFLGAGGFIHELIYASTERPFLISASLALMGLPFVLAGEERLKKKEEE